MTQIEYIKYLREVEGKSIRAIAKKVECSWATAKKYADGEVNLQTRGRRKRSHRVIGPYVDVIDAWMEEDQRRPTKQRRTAEKIFRDLKALGYEGSGRTVRAYVRKRRLEMCQSATEQYIRLEHAPATAQVDFGEFRAVYEGQEVTAHKVVISFPYSNAHAAWVVPSQNAVCFLHGLARLFEWMGGVPQEIWFDNLTPAVKKVLEGPKRTLTGLFESFKWHYRFKAVFCNPGRGHEKGSVENKVGYIRRNFLAPMPMIDDWDRFSIALNEQLKTDWQRTHYTKEVSIAKLWEDDQKQLLALPETPLEVAQFQRATVTHYGEVKIDHQVYHVPTVSPGRKVLVKAYWDHIDILDEHGEAKLYTSARRYMMNPKEIDWASELELYTRRPRAIEHAAYLKALSTPIRQYLLASELSQRRKRIEAMVEVLRQHPIEAAEQAAQTALQTGRVDSASLKAFASFAADPGAPAPLDEPWTPGEVAAWTADLSAYDRLVMNG